MRRTLTIVVIVIALTAVAASASIFTELVFGKHSVDNIAGITYVLDEKVPGPWVNDPALATRYWNSKPIFQGTELHVKVLITTGAPTGRVFSLWMSDGYSDLTYDSKAKRTDEMQTGGLRQIGTAKVGKAGEWVIPIDENVTPGSYFLYVMALRDGKHQPFSEKPLVIQVAPPFPDMAKALQNASDKTLDAWGLEATTLEDVAPSRDTSQARFDLTFADGGSIKSVNIVSDPVVGRVLGIFQGSEMIGTARVDQVQGNQVYSSNPSAFLREVEGRENTLKVMWVMRIQVHTTDRVRALTAEEEAFASACPYPDLQKALRGMLGRNVIHVPYKWREELRAAKYCSNWWAKQAPHWWGIWQAITVDKYCWVPEPIHLPAAVVRKTRVIGLAYGVPIIDVSEVTRERTDTGGLLSFVVVAKRPDSINNSSESNSASASASEATNITDVDSTNVNINENASQSQ